MERKLSLPSDPFVWGFLVTGLTVQVGTYLWMPENPWSLVSGMFGICSVVLCSGGSIWTFFFGFGQILTYSYLCYLEHFYAGIAMNVFYFLSQIYGIWCWHHRIQNSGEKTLVTRSIGGMRMLLLATVTLAASWLTGWMLAHYTNDTQPYLDAFTTVPAIAAQILMVMAYREHWFIWFAIDLLYLLLWARAENYCMVMQYAFWIVNCVYGFIRWTQSLHCHSRLGH